MNKHLFKNVSETDLILTRQRRIINSLNDLLIFNPKRLKRIIFNRKDNKTTLSEKININNSETKNSNNTINTNNTNNTNKINLNLVNSEKTKEDIFKLSNRKLRIVKGLNKLHSSRSEIIISKNKTQLENIINNNKREILTYKTRTKPLPKLKQINYSFSENKNKMMQKNLEKLKNNKMKLQKDLKETKTETILDNQNNNNIEPNKILDVYANEEIDNDTYDLKKTVYMNDYISPEFEKTNFAGDKNSFNIFYKKANKDNEIIRKGGKNHQTPSFNLIRASKKYKIIPNPIGVVKKEGENDKLNLRNKILGDDYIKCLIESLKVSKHITSLNLEKNRLSDMSLIPLFQTIIENNYLLDKLLEINLSYNKIGIAAIELLVKYISNYNCVLQNLNMENNLLGDVNTKKIIEAISNNLMNEMKYLNLSKNLLDDEVAIDLSILIKKCIKLNVLILYQNQLSNEGGGIIMSEIKKHTGLKILDLSWNLLGTNLKDEIPTLNELLLVNKEYNTNTINHFDNANLNEMKYALKQNIYNLNNINNSILPDRNDNKVSYFTSELCKLFHNKYCELLHLDLSYNNLNYHDCKAISEHIKYNHTILGIHVDGNDMWVDELGFVYPIEKSKYKQNHFAQSQIFYRITNDHPLARSNIINVQKLRSKNNCWICEGWREIKFHYKPNKYEGDLEKAYVRLHLNFENYKSFQLNLEEDSFVCHRMCPSGDLTFFLTMNGIPVDNYGQITHELKDAIIYTQEERPKEFEDEEDDNDNSDDNKELKKFIITKVAQTKVEINPDVILADSGYTKNIKYCVPRPEKNMLKKRPRTPWTFPSSIWAYYGYDYEGEPESVYNNAFEFDYNRCNFSKDKDLSSDDEFELKNILKNKYKKIVETYKNLSAYLGWKIWQIGQNQITEFVSSCPDLLDKNYLINDVLVKVTEVKSNAIDKQDRKKNSNIPDNIIRHQFMMLLVRIAKDKYFRTKQMPSIVDAVDYSFEHHYDFYLNQFDNHKWRKERYYNEQVDNILKAFIPIFDALFYSYAPQQIMGRKDSFWLTLEGYTNLCNNLMDTDFPVKELPVLFSLSLRLTTNEIDYDKQYNMVFPEFLEAICRFIDKLSPIPPGEDAAKWDMKRRQAQPLKNKIQTMIPSLTRLISGAYRNVRDKFVTPAKEEDVDLYKIDYDNPLYDGKLPKRSKKKRNSLLMG